MQVNVAVFDKTMAAGDDGYIFEFVMNDPDLGKFITDCTNESSFDHIEVWTSK